MPLHISAGRRYEKRAFLELFYAKSDHFYQDRLGTNIGKALKQEMRFVQGNSVTGCRHEESWLRNQVRVFFVRYVVYFRIKREIVCQDRLGTNM